MANKGIGSTSDIRKKLSFDYELITTCYHEAGHTISGILNYFMISEVGIEITKEGKKTIDAGYTNFFPPLEFEEINDENLFNIFLISEIQMNYAGLAAEKLFYKELCGTDQLPMFLKYGSYADRDRVAELIKKYNLAPPGKKRHSLKKKLFNESRWALEDYWPDVKLVSHTLFSKRKLYWDDIKNLLMRKSTNKTFWKKRFKDIDCIFEAAKTDDEHLVHSILI